MTLYIISEDVIRFIKSFGLFIFFDELSTIKSIMANYRVIK